MVYFSIFYVIFLSALFTSKEILFLNEEFLIADCMSLVFIYLTILTRKTINFLFFYKVEAIYFSFLHLIKLNIKLIEKMLNLVNLKVLHFEKLVIAELRVFVKSFSNEILESQKLMQFMLVKNFIFSIISNFFLFDFFSSSNKLITNLSVNDEILIQDIKLQDDSNFFSIKREDSADLLNEIYDSELDDLISDSNQDVSVVNHIVDIDNEEEIYFLFDFTN